jgi:hypothetical protein
MAAHDLFDPAARRRARSVRAEPDADSRTSGAPVAGDVAPALAPPRRGGRTFWAVVALLAVLVAWGVVGLRRAGPSLAAGDVDGRAAAAASTGTVDGGEVLADPADAGLPGGTGAAGGVARGADPATAPIAGPAPTPGRPVDAGAVRRFVFWAEQGGAGALAAQSEPGHPVVREGIGLLADALDAVGGDAARVAAIRARADQLGGSQTDAAAHVHAALVAAARLLGGLRGDGAPDLLAAARGVLPGQPLDAQAPAVRAAFRQAAAALPAR